MVSRNSVRFWLKFTSWLYKLHLRLTGKCRIRPNKSYFWISKFLFYIKIGCDLVFFSFEVKRVIKTNVFWQSPAAGFRQRSGWRIKSNLCWPKSVLLLMRSRRVVFQNTKCVKINALMRTAASVLHVQCFASAMSWRQMTLWLIVI